ncbi:TPA: hypothetical protein ACFRG8_000785 [Neisseria lactamica]|nr:hypothetical protein [Neisseria lactamica]
MPSEGSDGICAAWETGGRPERRASPPSASMRLPRWYRSRKVSGSGFKAA